MTTTTDSNLVELLKERAIEARNALNEAAVAYQEVLAKAREARRAVARAESRANKYVGALWAEGIGQEDEDWDWLEPECPAVWEYRAEK